MIERRIREQTNISISSNFINIFIARMDEKIFSPNVVMWFLPCLFVTKMLYDLINKIKNDKYKLLIILFSTIIGFILCYYKIILPWGFETALIALSFMYVGAILKESVNLENIFNRKILIWIGISILNLSLCIIFDNKVNMLSHKYGNIILFFLGSYSGIYLIFVISKLFKKNKFLINIFTFLGKNSILIMIFSDPVKRIVIKIVSFITNKNVEILREDIIMCIFITIIVVLLIIPFIFIINKKFSFLIGKKKIKSVEVEKL